MKSKEKSMYAHGRGVVNNTFDTVSDSISMARRAVHIGDMKLQRHERKEALKLEKFEFKHQVKLDQWKAKTAPPSTKPTRRKAS